MWEEIDAECRRAIELGRVDRPIRFCRRHRWATLALDVHGDDTVVLVATRGKRSGGGVGSREYRRREGTWSEVGFAGGAGGDRQLPPRPAPGERWFRHTASGMHLDDTTLRMPWRSARVRYGALIAATGVSSARWRGRRRPVADHGFVCVVWRGRRMPRVDLFDAEGRRVDRVRGRDLQSPIRRMPLWARVRFAIHRRRHPGEWFNYAPRRTRRDRSR